MVKPVKRRVPGGRVTPKKGDTNGGRARPGQSRRYTPPVPVELKTSPPWVPVLMFSLLGLGALVIILNYLAVLPGATSNAYLGIGLLAICGGIVAATQYR